MGLLIRISTGRKDTLSDLCPWKYFGEAEYTTNDEEENRQKVIEVCIA